MTEHDERTRQAILAAARERFGRDGYRAATLEAIAADAGVDVEGLRADYGTKEGVFVAATGMPFRPSEVIGSALEGGRDGRGDRLVRLLLGLYEDPAALAAMRGFIGEAMTRDETAAMLREFIGEEMVARVAAEIEGPDPELRATLIGSQMAGLAMLRHVLRVEPLASADPDLVAALVAPNLQRYLGG